MSYASNGPGTPGDQLLYHRALVLTSKSEPITVQTLPIPPCVPGSAVVRILAAPIVSYAGDVYSGAPTRAHYSFPTPFTPGTSAIGRVTAVDVDATSLTPGQLVFIDCVIRARDDPDTMFLSGLTDGHSAESKMLMRDAWRDSTYAQFARVPLESCTVLNEATLLGAVADGGLGLDLDILCDIGRLLVPFGGLRDIDLRTGEIIVVAPATGPFGGAAVQVALGMGARVIAMGRNEMVLAKLAASSPRVATVKISGDVDVEVAALKRAASGGVIDAVFDISPAEAAGSTHLKSAILALRKGGRVSLMGGWKGDVGFPHSKIMRSNIVLRGKWMYEREDVRVLLRMIETGDMPFGAAVGVRVVGRYSLEEWKDGFQGAAVNNEPGMLSVFVP